MRICFLIPGLSGGGAEFVAREWATWFARQGHEVTVAITIKGSRPPGDDQYEIVELDGTSLVSHSLALRRIIKERNFEVIVSLLPYYNIMALAATRVMKNRPRVFVSGRNVEVPFPEVHGKRFRITRVLAKTLYPLCDGYIAISHPVAAEACALYRVNIAKVFVVPNPATAKVDRGLGSSAITRPNRDRSQPGILNIVVPARIVDQKRPMVALAAAEILKKKFEAVVVHFYGVGILQQAVEEEATRMAVSTNFHGWKEEWFAQLPLNSVVLLTSLVEGFGNVLVEAAAVGTPSVVSSRCLGAADAVVPGITGELVLSDSAVDYASAVERAVRLEVSGSGVTRWLQRFGPESSGQALLAAIQNTTGAH